MQLLFSRNICRNLNFQQNIVWYICAKTLIINLLHVKYCMTAWQLSKHKNSEQQKKGRSFCFFWETFVKIPIFSRISERRSIVNLLHVLHNTFSLNKEDRIFNDQEILNVVGYGSVRTRRCSGKALFMLYIAALR